MIHYTTWEKAEYLQSRLTVLNVALNFTRGMALSQASGAQENAPHRVVNQLGQKESAKIVVLSLNPLTILSRGFVVAGAIPNLSHPMLRVKVICWSMTPKRAANAYSTASLWKRSWVAYWSGTRPFTTLMVIRPITESRTYNFILATIAKVHTLSAVTAALSTSFSPQFKLIASGN